MKTSLCILIATTVFVEALTTPTHIIKFKDSVGGSTEGKMDPRPVVLCPQLQFFSARSLILKQHRAYVLANHHKFASKSHKELSKEELTVWADSLSKQLSLESITVDDDFLAVAGVFGDANFVKYLHTKQDIDYVEQNQMYRAAFIIPQQEQEKTVQPVKGPAANWGLARITQRQRQAYDQYYFDRSAG